MKSELESLEEVLFIIVGDVRPGGIITSPSIL
jgi:hypothetical protein